MGVGTPCPMPPGNREAIHLQITTLKALGCDRFEIADKIQDIWPGCTANHVRGVIAGLKSKELGGRDTRKQRILRTAEPWKPGAPKPSGAR